jgi:hypothetical protein
MITLTSAKRRAEEFAAAVDAPSPSPSRLRPELAELVDVVATLRAHPGPDDAPRADFSASLRERLMIEAERTWTYDPAAARLTLPPRPGGRRERRLAAAATALVLAGGTAGMAAAAQQALPGEALYPIKRGIEDVRTDLTGDEAAKGRTLLDQASNRLTEARALADRGGNDAAVGATIDTFRTQAVSGSDLLIESYGASGDEAAVTDVRAFTQDGLTQLEALTGVVPADLQAPVQEAALTLQEIELRAVQACPTCGSDDALAPVSDAFTPAMDAARVLAALDAAALRNDHPLVSDRLAPPSAKQASGGDSAGSGGTDTDVVGDSTRKVTGDTSGDGPGEGLLEGVTGVDATTPNLSDPLRKTEDAVKDSLDSVRKGVTKQTEKAATDTVGKTTETAKKTVEDVTEPLLDPKLP